MMELTTFEILVIASSFWKIEIRSYETLHKSENKFGLHKSENNIATLK